MDILQMEDEENQLSKKKLEAKKDSEAVRIPLKLMRDAVKVSRSLVHM